MQLWVLILCCMISGVQRARILEISLQEDAKRFQLNPIRQTRFKRLDIPPECSLAALYTSVDCSGRSGISVRPPIQRFLRDGWIRAFLFFFLSFIFCFFGCSIEPYFRWNPANFTERALHSGVELHCGCRLCAGRCESSALSGRGFRDLRTKFS